MAPDAAWSSWNIRIGIQRHQWRNKGVDLGVRREQRTLTCTGTGNYGCTGRSLTSSCRNGIEHRESLVEMNAFVNAEEKGFVLLDRTAQRAAKIVSLQ